MTHKLSTILVALIALTALLAAACSSGGDDQAAAPDGQQGDASVASSDGDGSTGNAAERVSAAAARTAQLESYQFAMEFGVEGVPDLPGAMVFSAEGAIDSVNGRLRMRIDLHSILDAAPAGTDDAELELIRSLLGDGIIEFISDGETVYLQWSLFTTLFGADTKWVSFADDSGDALGGLNVEQLSPDSFLAFFSSVGDIEDRGSAVTRGVDTTHYVGTLDLAQAIVLADPAQAEEVERQIAELGIDSLGTMPVELWIDGDGFLRRFTMDFDFSQLGEAAAAEIGAGRLFISADFFNFGDAVQITLPSADEVTELDGSSLFGGGF